jgi:hypothetical protein
MRKFGGLAGATSQPPTKRRMERALARCSVPTFPRGSTPAPITSPRRPCTSNCTTVRMPNFVGWDCRASTSGRSFARHAIELHTQVRSRGQKMVSKALFEQLVLPHMPAAFNLAYWIVRSRDEAEDVVQDA